MGRSRWLALSVAFAGLFGFVAAPALGMPLMVVSQDGPQDPLTIQGAVHELIDNTGIPIGERIESSHVETTLTACFDGSDDPNVPNILVSITNLTGVNWFDLHYVADYDTNPPAGAPAQWVTVSNSDGWIGNNANDLSLAFKIDSVGINRPLVFESMTANQIFEPGETWEFILQDWWRSAQIVGGVGPTPLASWGIAAASPNATLSTGSIIAVIPEPTTLSLLALGALGLLRRRRKH
jgi:hypothetical protein